MTLEEIVIRAIPADYNCAVKNAAAMNRRIVLLRRINAYLSEQLSKQFNAKPVSDQFSARIQGVDN